MSEETLSRSSAPALGEPSPQLEPGAVSGLDETTSRRALPVLPEPADLAGRLLDGRFRVEARLGRGGMGAVYRATQVGVTERPVAVKVILPERVGGTDALARFEREARAAARLGHPNTLRIFEFGQTPDGIPYLVTELLSGRSVAEELGRAGALPVPRALRIMVQVLASLSEAHALGIVHRDLKPDNLFLADVAGADDFVKVIDFGLATLPVEASDERLTTDGQTLGTPAYMSPEQVHGKVVGPAGDLYAVGVILFEMLTGRRPFGGNTPFDTMRAHVMDPAPALEIPGGHVPHALREVVARCLEKRPEHRPESADALRRELAGILAHAEAGVVPAPRSAAPEGGGEQHDLSVSTGPALRVPQRSVARWAAGAAVVVAALVVGVLWGLGGRDPAPATQPAPAPQPPPARAAAVPEAPLERPSEQPPVQPADQAPGPPAARAPAVLRSGELPDRAEQRASVPHVQVTITSTPPQATVSVEGHVIGRTPAEAWIPEGAARRARVQLPGYRPAAVQLPASGPVDVRLKPAGLDVKDFATDDEKRLLDRLGGP